MVNNKQQQRRSNRTPRGTLVGAGRRNLRTRSSRVRRNNNSSSSSSKTANIRLPTQREIRFFTRPVSDDGSVTSSWLDKLWGFGIIALKLFLVAVTRVNNGLSEVKAYPTGATQCILIGIDECLINHPFIQWAKYGTSRYPTLPYALGKIGRVSVRVRAGAKLSERAGRLAVALVEISRREAEDLLTARKKAPTPKWKTVNDYAYEDILQIPGSRSAPLQTAINLNWRPTSTSFAKEMLEVGQPEITGDDMKQNVLPGGLPFLRLIIGYSDFASDTGSVTELYGADEAEFNVNISSTVSLQYPRTSFLRAVAPKTTDDETIAVSTAEQFGKDSVNVDPRDVIMRSDGIYLADGALERARMKSMEI